MRPLKLYIHGINSFFSPAYINFETLGEGGIFGIFGNTGSGKSTIVDSIIFALYGDTNEKSLNLSDYINKRLNEAEVRLEFTLTDLNEKIHFYEILRIIAIDGRTGVAKPARAELWEVTDERISLASGSREVTSKIVELIGLTMREFVHCVVLEQNKYDNFVKATDAERKEMVGNLFGLQRYGAHLAEVVKQREAELKMLVAELSARINTLEDATEENVQSLRAQVKLHAVAAAKTAAQLAEIKTEVETGAADATQAQARAAVEAEIEGLAKELAVASKEAEKATVKYKEVCEDALKRERVSRQAIEACIKVASRLEQNVGIDEEITSSRNKLRSSKKKLDEVSLRLEETNEELFRLDGDWMRARQDKQKLIARYLLLSSVTLNASDDEALLERVAQYNNGLSISVQKYSEHTEALRLAQEQATKDLETERLATIAQVTATKAVEIARQECQSAEEIYTLAAEELESCRRENLIATTIASLHEGDVCPICGQTIEKFSAVDTSDITRLEVKTRELRTRKEVARAHLEEVLDLYRKADNAFAVATGVGTAAKNRIEHARLAVSELGLANTCVDQLTRCNETGVALKAVIKTINSVNKLRESAQANKTIVVAERERLEIDTQSLEEKLTTLSSRREDLLGGTATVAAATKANDKKKATLEAEIESTVENVAACRLTLQEKNEVYAGVKARDIAAQRRIETLPKIEFDIMAYARIKKRYDEKVAQDRFAATEGARLEAHLLRMETDFTSAQNSRKEKTSVDARLALLERIKKMTGSGKLMEWLSEEYIEDFTELASEKLSILTNGEMELRYTQKGFTIVDNFNNRAERKVATVSGGETFLVSLSLAVAIAAKLEERAGARRIEFLFIDEGFGTLSADKIDLVMDALASLAKEDFVVGFISHVQEMRSRIPRQLNVTRDSVEEGSHVEIV